MKRLYAGIALVIVLCAIITVGKIQVNKFYNELDGTFTKMRVSVNNKEFSKAITLTKQAEKQWVYTEKIMGLFVNRSDLNEVGVMLSGLVPLLEEKETAQYLSELQQARVRLEHIRHLEQISSS